ncbi:hypothetical protein [[Eubacterium] cellulosolvens]
MTKICTYCNNVNEDIAYICARCSRPLTDQYTRRDDFPSPPLLYRPMMAVVPCAYHPTIPFLFTCSRCGKPICGACSKISLGVVLCAECAHNMPYVGVLPVYPALFYGLPVQRIR